MTRCVFLFCGAVVMTASAQVFNTLVAFDGTNGNTPHDALVQGIDGNFYGTTTQVFDCIGNWGCGTVFKVTPTGSLTMLHIFTGPDGEVPTGLVQATDGNFYGTTTHGGTHRHGAIFKMTATGAGTRLYNFCPERDCVDGSEPSKLVQGSDGNFYGTTQLGGDKNRGTVFKLIPNGTLITLHSFIGEDGAEPFSFAGLIQATDGNFYGTTSIGGTNNRGAVFKITPAGALTTVYSFCPAFGCNDGFDLVSALVQAADGNFYGTTLEGGSTGRGTVFKITPKGTLTTLYAFCVPTGCTDGARPVGDAGPNCD